MQVLIVIALGVASGLVWPAIGAAPKPLGDGCNLDGTKIYMTVAATLSVIPDIPNQALAVLIGIDKFMSQWRALTNLVCNGVACVAVSA